jgi:hypothetical protein
MNKNSKKYTKYGEIKMKNMKIWEKIYFEK